MDERLVDLIYEAAVLPDLWPRLLESIGDRFGARGGLLFANHQTETKWLGGGPVVDVMREYIAQGWADHNPRPAILVERKHPGFLTELDIVSERDTHELPIFKRFLRPTGFFATVGTYVEGLTSDRMILSIEGFPSHQASRDAVPALDRLWPHLARAVQLSSQFRLERLRGHVEAMEAIGAAACVIDSRGVLRTRTHSSWRSSARRFLRATVGCSSVIPMLTGFCFKRWERWLCGQALVAPYRYATSHDR